MRMRFPYIYQLMLGFLLVIITLMSITSISIIHFGRKQVINEVEETFLNYANLIEETGFDENQLNSYNHIFGNQGIEYGIFDEYGELKYPKMNQQFQTNLTPEDIEALKAGESLLLRTKPNTLRKNTEDTVSIYVPIFTENDRYQGFIGLGRPVSYIENNIDELKDNVWRAFLISTVFAVIVSLLLSFYLVHRVNRLSKATQKVAMGDYNIYISHSNRDEIDRLSADFNKMIKALKEWRSEVIHLEDRRKTFMQDVAHEMRTPLTTINGLLEGMEYGVFDEEQQMRSIKIMRKETTRLIRLVNENLDYENIQSNRIVLNKHHFPLNEAMTEIIEQLKPIAKESDNEIVFDDEFKDIKVYADFDRFKQIIVNLIKNSLQFTTNGTVTIDAMETKEYSQISISDTGIGMSTEQMENIWDRYYKADASRKNTKYGESGLGLPIVKQLVELHDGNIEVKSELDKGTVFTIKFPKKKIQKAEE